MDRSAVTVSSLGFRKRRGLSKRRAYIDGGGAAARPVKYYRVISPAIGKQQLWKNKYEPLCTESSYALNVLIVRTYRKISMRHAMFPQARSSGLTSCNAGEDNYDGGDRVRDAFLLSCSLAASRPRLDDIDRNDDATFILQIYAPPDWHRGRSATYSRVHRLHVREGTPASHGRVGM